MLKIRKLYAVLLLIIVFNIAPLAVFAAPIAGNQLVNSYYGYNSTVDTPLSIGYQYLVSGATDYIDGSDTTGASFAGSYYYYFKMSKTLNNVQSIRLLAGEAGTMYFYDGVTNTRIGSYNFGANDIVYHGVDISNVRVIAVKLNNNSVVKEMFVSENPLPDYTPPANPTQFNVDSKTHNSVNVSWKNPLDTDLKTIKIYNPSLIYTSTIETGFIGASRSATINGLEAETNYTFRITATDVTGNESSGTNLEIKTSPLPDTTPPAVPTNISDVEGNEFVVLSWTNPTDSDFKGVNIYQGDTKIAGPVTGTSYTVNGLTNNKSYSFSISSVDLTGNESARSGAIHATPGDFIPPLAPVGLKATAGESKVTLTWTANTDDGIAYNIYQDGVKISGPITGTSYVVASGLTAGITYNFSITALDKSLNESGHSDTVSGKYFDTTPPAVPYGLVATPGDKQVQLSWADNTTDSDMSKTHIYKNGVYLNTVNHPITSFLVTGLTNGTEYSFVIHAEDKSGNVSAASIVAKVTPFVPVIKPVAVAKSTNKRVDLTWTAVPNASQYKVYKNVALLTETSTLSYTDVDVQNGTVYTYEVSAVVDGTEGVRSQPVAARPGDFIDFDPGNGGGFGNQVLDAIETGWSFTKKYALYICLLLGLILSPTLLSFVVWLISKIRSKPGGQKKGAKVQRQPLTLEEKEKRVRDRKLNKVRDEKYQTLTRMNRTAERDTWVKSTGYLRPEERQQKAREQRNAQAREQRAAAKDSKPRSSGGRSQRSGRTTRNTRKGR